METSKELLPDPLELIRDLEKQKHDLDLRIMHLIKTFGVCWNCAKEYKDNKNKTGECPTCYNAWRVLDG